MTPAKLADAVTPAHSPGPWRVCGANRGKCVCGQIWSVGNDMPVATAFRQDDEVGALPEETWHANADLIASAPALLVERDAMAAENGRLREQNAKLAALLGSLRKSTKRAPFNVLRDVDALLAEIKAGA